MSFKQRDNWLGGFKSNAYLPLYSWAEIPEPIGVGEQNCVEYILESQANLINDIFGQLYFPYRSIDEEGNEVETYLDCGLTNNEIYNDFLALYGELCLMRPYYFDNEVANRVSINRLIALFAAVCHENYWKYKKLAATLGFKYNPIENYAMKEEGKDTETPSGSETHSHIIDNNKSSVYEASGPLASVNAGAPDSEGFKSLDFTMATSYNLGYTEKSVSDIEAGKTAVMNGSPATTNGATPTTKNYTTTMDNAATGRLESYQETTGDTAQAQNVVGSREVVPMGKIRVGSESPSFTDTTTYTNKKVDKDHTFSRNGNIGVMSTQDMINQEREVVRFSLEKEFFEDIKAKLLLHIWN